MWIKYKHRFAYGQDRNWTYIEVNPKDIDEHIEEIMKKYDWSDKYRGIEWHKVNKLPLSELRKNRMYHFNKRNYHEDQHVRFLKMEVNRIKSNIRKQKHGSNTISNDVPSRSHKR